MMLGKRPRYPIKRTTSMTEFSFDLNSPAATSAEGLSSPLTLAKKEGLLAPSMSLSPRNFRRNSADFSAETTHFLRYCLLCKGRLVPGRDIYMYRGDSAFCSAECREKQMKQDERKDKAKCSLSATKKISQISIFYLI